jgi:hypothetical protein
VDGAGGTKNLYHCDKRHTDPDRLLLSVAAQITRGTGTMKAPTSEYRREAARLRALIAQATTARARLHLEEQVRLNERLATGRPQAARRDVLDQAA